MPVASQVAFTCRIRAGATASENASYKPGADRRHAANVVFTPFIRSEIRCVLLLERDQST